MFDISHSEKNLLKNNCFREECRGILELSINTRWRERNLENCTKFEISSISKFSNAVINGRLHHLLTLNQRVYIQKILEKKSSSKENSEALKKVVYKFLNWSTWLEMVKLCIMRHNNSKK